MPVAAVYTQIPGQKTWRLHSVSERVDDASIVAQTIEAQHRARGVRTLVISCEHREAVRAELANVKPAELIEQQGHGQLDQSLQIPCGSAAIGRPLPNEHGTVPLASEMGIAPLAKMAACRVERDQLMEGRHGRL